jgi:PqqA peptide cyclase
VRAAGLPLTINPPIHRHNIEEVPEFIELALSLGAERLEIASVQYARWALVNRDALMPSRASVERQVEIVETAWRAQHGHRAVNDKQSIKLRRKRAGWDPKYLASTLGQLRR